MPSQSKAPTRTILSIIPATGWQTVFTEKSSGRLLVGPLVCWALVEEDGDRWVMGMENAGDHVDFSEYSNHVGYLGPGEDLQAMFGEDAPVVESGEAEGNM